MEYLIPEEFSQLVRLTQQFVEKELLPHEAQVECDNNVTDELRKKLRLKARELGLFAFNMPEDVGGPGLPYFAQVLIREQLGKVSVALADMVGRPPKALLACRGEQRERFLLPAVRAEKTWAFALTEPDAGSDAGAMKTRAAQTTGGWVLNGTKHFISHGDFADFVIVIAKISSEGRDLPTAFLVEHNTQGFKVGRIHPKMG